MRNTLEYVGAAAIVAVPYLLAWEYVAFLAIFALACLLPKAYHFRAWGLVISNVLGIIGWIYGGIL